MVDVGKRVTGGKVKCVEDQRLVSSFVVIHIRSVRHDGLPLSCICHGVSCCMSDRVTNGGFALGEYQGRKQRTTALFVIIRKCVVHMFSSVKGHSKNGLIALCDVCSWILFYDSKLFA